ncbi:hypothetical protein GCK32_008549, partial [Trichostrongylus colubriformis]
CWCGGIILLRSNVLEAAFKRNAENGFHSYADWHWRYTY